LSLSQPSQSSMTMSQSERAEQIRCCQSISLSDLIIITITSLLITSVQSILLIDPSETLKYICLPLIIILPSYSFPLHNAAHHISNNTSSPNLIDDIFQSFI